MRDPKIVIEDIRNVLYSGQEPLNGNLRTLATDYAELCQEVNRRLARCEEFLGQKLLGEAIQYAETEPNVLDWLTILDFTERPQWEQKLQTAELPPVPLMRRATAEALNSAYAEVKPLEHLLRQHRVLALARAPLGDRLNVLRQLAQINGQNPVWQQDMMIFGTARAQQFQREIVELQQEKGLPSLERLLALYKELQEFPLVLPIDLAAAVQEMIQRVQTYNCQVRFHKLSEALREAYQRSDSERAKTLLQEWDQALAVFPLSPNDQRCEDVNTIQEWLEQLALREAKANNLQSSLEELRRAIRQASISDDELVEIFEEAKALGPVPEGLKKAYISRLNKIRIKREKSERVILAVAIAVIFLVFVVGMGAFLYFAVWRNR